MTDYVVIVSKWDINAYTQIKVQKRTQGIIVDPVAIVSVTDSLPVAQKPGFYVI